MTNWVLIEDEIKSALIAKVFWRAGLPGRMLVLPCDRDRDAWSREFIGNAGCASLPACISVGDETSQWTDVERQVDQFASDDLLVILDIQLKDRSQKEFVRLDLLLKGPPGDYWASLLQRPTNDMIITSYWVAGGERDRLLERFTPPGRINRARNSVENPADEYGARLLLTEAFAWLLKQQPQRLHGPQGLYSLYTVCYGLKWDDWAGTPATRSFFGHDLFDSNDSRHTGLMCKWLEVANCDDRLYIKGLFMSNGFARITPCKCVSAEYIIAALKRLGVTVPVFVSCAHVNLPVAPGIAFLVSMAELVKELSRDNSDSKLRPPPDEITFYCSNENQYGVKFLLPNGGAAILRTKVSEGKNCGAAGALSNLLRAHCVESPANQEWSPLFRADNGQAVAGLDSDGGDNIIITWTA